MDTNEMIPANDWCTHHHIEMSFISSLEASGLISLLHEEQQVLLPVEELPNLEKMARWHYDMDINLEGIETISHLLNKMEALQQKIDQLHARLTLYEPLD